MHKSAKLLVYIYAITLIGVPALAEWIPIRVIVDKTNIGDLTTNLDKKGKAVSVKGPELINMLNSYIQPDKITRILKLTEKDESLTLENLTRVGITPSYNEKELALTLAIPLELRIVKDFPLTFTARKTGLSVYNQNYSGFLNFRGLLGYSDSTTPTNYNFQKSPITGQFELVQNLNYFTFETTANYKEFDVGPIQRYDTSLVHDFEDQQMRLRLGDFYTSAQGYQATLQAAGIQFQKQFGIYPNRNSNKRSTTVQVKNSSLMEVFVNNNLILRTRVNPGPYNLKELPLLYGRNVVRVVLSDDFGGKEEFEVDLLFDDQILIRGVHDFSYQVGRPSYFVGNEKKYYEDNYTSFFHKYGLTDDVTIFFNHQNYKSSNLFGAGLGAVTRFGSNFFDIAHYSDESVNSEKASMWRYNSPEINLKYFDRFRLLGGAEFKSLGFKTISTTPVSPANYSEKYDLLFQKQLTETSFMGLAFTKLTGQNLGSNDFTRRLTYQSQFFRNWRFDLNYSWTERQPDLDQILVSLNWQEATGRNQASFAHDTVSSSSSVRVTKNNQVNYNDLQLSMYADKQKPRTALVESQNVDLSGNYYATKYEVRAQLTGNSTGTDLTTNGQLGFGSAFAWTSEGVGLSRPITDSFAIVEAEGVGRGRYLTIPNGLERDSIKIKNNESFVFSNLASYIDQPLKLDSTNLGLSSHLDREAYILSTKYRSGLYVPLKVIKSLVVKGKLTSSKPEQVKYAQGRILTSDGQVFSNNFFTDESGYFIIDGLSYGQYQIELSDSKLKKISFELVESAESEKARESGVSEDSDASEYEMGTIGVEKEK